MRPHPTGIDLHCHSTASDGQLTPAELVERAVDRSVTLLALTDHDTLSGWEALRLAAAPTELELVPGIELSCLWRNRTVHILGLGVGPDTDAMQEAQRQQEDTRYRRAAEIARKLVRVGGDDLLERASRRASGPPGRPHFAAALVESGAVPSEMLAFRRYLGAGKAGDVRQCWPDLACVIDWIRQAGGVAVLAHPRKYRMTATWLRRLVGDFMAAGGEGLEVETGGQSVDDRRFLADLCRQNGLLASTGSDFHRPGEPWNELGSRPALPGDLPPVWERFQGAWKKR